MLIGTQNGTLKRRRINLLPIVRHVVHGSDHHAARNLTRRMPAEPVGNDIDGG